MNSSPQPVSPGKESTEQWCGLNPSHSPKTSPQPSRSPLASRSPIKSPDASQGAALGSGPCLTPHPTFHSWWGFHFSAGRGGGDCDERGNVICVCCSLVYVFLPIADLIPEEFNPCREEGRKEAEEGDVEEMGGNT